jgi:hypothetical protein
MARIISGPRKVDFNAVKQLINRMHPEQGDEDQVVRISADSVDVPSWQRNVVWTNDEQGLLALSIVRNYPIGLIILWRKPNNISVPIDGRQRLTAIDRFYSGLVAIPDLPGVPDEYKNRKFRLREGDGGRYQLLGVKDRENFEFYEPQIVEYERVDEPTAMDIFIKLQGGKSLNKSEVRAALGGKVCDFVTDLTSPSTATTEDDEDEIEPSSHHPFFQQVNLRNVRKAHRALCDVLLHEHLYPGVDKHWTSLETMYREKSISLTDRDKTNFSASLGKFQRACTVTAKGKKILLPQLRSTFLILTFYRAWREVEEVYTNPSGYSFASIIRDFETLREEGGDQSPWLNFTSALSNAGYSRGRIKERHDILMSFILRQFPEMKPKDVNRTFTEAQKIAIWDRAKRQCEFESNGRRCTKTFANFRQADADHILRWNDGGPTTLSNGRLLCQQHNRGRGQILGTR